MSQLDMDDWVCEKLEYVVEALARIADIAKDPETPEWYRRNLRQHLTLGFNGALKVVCYAHDCTNDWKPEHVAQAVEHGTLGVAALLGELGIPHRLDPGEPTIDLDDESDREPPTSDEVPAPVDDPWTGIRREIISHTIFRLAGSELADNERRLLAWIAWHVARSDYEDVALMTERFLASDVGLSKEDGQAALAALLDKKAIELVPELRDETRVAIRLRVDGLNDRRHGPPSVH
jgi:hypothetical protein